jgi:hypothetical protein
VGKIRRFELRVGDKIWAVLLVSGQDKVLQHNLDETQVAVCPGLLAYDEAGQALRVVQGGEMFLVDQNGAIQLKAAVCSDNSVADIIDRSGKVALTIKLVGPGNAGNGPVVAGDLMLGLQSLRD